MGDDVGADDVSIIIGQKVVDHGEMDEETVGSSTACGIRCVELPISTWSALLLTLQNINAVEGEGGDGVVMLGLHIPDDKKLAIFKQIKFKYAARYILFEKLVHERTTEARPLLPAFIDRAGYTCPELETKRCKITTTDGNANIHKMMTTEVRNMLHGTLKRYGIVDTPLKGDKYLSDCDFPGSPLINTARLRVLPYLDENERILFCNRQLHGMEPDENLYIDLLFEEPCIGEKRKGLDNTKNPKKVKLEASKQKKGNALPSTRTIVANEYKRAYHHAVIGGRATTIYWKIWTMCLGICLCIQLIRFIVPIPPFLVGAHGENLIMFLIRLTTAVATVYIRPGNIDWLLLLVFVVVGGPRMFSGDAPIMSGGCVLMLTHKIHWSVKYVLTAICVPLVLAYRLDTTGVYKLNMFAARWTVVLTSFNVKRINGATSLATIVIAPIRDFFCSVFILMYAIGNLVSM